VISKKMLSLLTAATLSGGVAATTAVVAPSVIASEQTMAEQYEPYYEPITNQGGETEYARLHSDLPLPSQTQVFFTDYPSGTGREKGITFTLIDWSTLGAIYFRDLGLGGSIPPGGATVEPRVTIIYPDGSAEIISASLTLIPLHKVSYDVRYGSPEISPGSSETFPVLSEIPSGSKISIVSLPEVAELRSAGWNFGVLDNGDLKVTAPENAQGMVTLQFLVVYPDGTQELSSTTVQVTPKDSELYEVTYGGVDVTGGDTVTASPTETDLPVGTRITLGENTALTAAGWGLEVTADGELTATAPTDADGTVEIALTVTYPDGTSEETTATITATPAPTDDEDDEDDQPVVPNRPKAGGSSFGSS
jgi:hypothetical protein